MSTQQGDLGSRPGLSRLAGKVALVVGGGQTPGVTVGNGRATAMVFAREGARVVVADRSMEAAEETVKAISAEGGEAMAVLADITDEDQIVAMVDAAMSRWQQVDILHNNVGVSLAGGDAVITEITSEAFDRVMGVNLKGMVFTCKHVIPVMRSQGGGSITNVSSLATEVNYPYVTYKTSKAGVNALTANLAMATAADGIRVNAILPGLMNTPMAVENRVGVLGTSREEVVAKRDALVPLGRKMGTGWDVAYAALYLNSDEARFVTGVTLFVDGGQRLQAVG